MRIAIIGVGGIGGYFGGKLADAYEKSGKHEIIFIARGEHLKAIHQSGLHLITQEGEYVVHPKVATDNPAEAGVLDLVFFCTKSYDLENSAQQFSSCITKKSIVIPLLNGVNSAERLHVILPQAVVLSGCVYVISCIESSGIVHQKERPGILTFGTDDETASKYQYILELLLHSKIQAILTNKISEVLWEKYMLICALASLTTATGKTYGGIMADANFRQKLKDMMKEVLAVARARKVILPDDCVDKAMDLIGNVAYDNKTSMQMDKEKGRLMETDIIPAYLCKMGKKLGVPTPLHDEIYKQLR